MLLTENPEKVPDNQHCMAASTAGPACSPGFFDAARIVPTPAPALADQRPHACCPGYFCPPELTCMMPCPTGAYCPRWVGAAFVVCTGAWVGGRAGSPCQCISSHGTWCACSACRAHPAPPPPAYKAHGDALWCAPYAYKERQDLGCGGADKASTPRSRRPDKLQACRAVFPPPAHSSCRVHGPPAAPLRSGASSPAPPSPPPAGPRAPARSTAREASTAPTPPPSSTARAATSAARCACGSAWPGRLHACSVRELLASRHAAFTLVLCVLLLMPPMPVPWALAAAAPPQGSTEPERCPLGASCPPNTEWVERNYTGKAIFLMTCWQGAVKRGLHTWGACRPSSPCFPSPSQASRWMPCSSSCCG